MCSSDLAVDCGVLYSQEIAAWANFARNVHCQRVIVDRYSFPDAPRRTHELMAEK